MGALPSSVRQGWEAGGGGESWQESGTELSDALTVPKCRKIDKLGSNECVFLGSRYKRRIEYAQKKLNRIPYYHQDYITTPKSAHYTYESLEK